MKKKIILLSLLLFIFPFITFSNIFGNNLLDDVNVTISFSISDGNTIFLGEDSFPYGASFSIDFNEVDNDYNFLYWIADGTIDLEKEMYSEFIATRDLNLVGVFHKDDEHAISFVDYSGKLIETKYLKDNLKTILEPINLPNKPGYNYNNPKWISLIGSKNLNDITESSVFKLNYKRSTDNSYIINVNGGTVSNNTPNYNEIVTVVANIANFTHWEENNVPVSYEKEYSFSALSNRNLIAKSGGTKESLLTISPNLNLRETHESFLSSIYLKDNDSLIEHGFITTNTNNDETIYKSSLLLKTTNEFLGSFNNDLNITTIKAYAIIKSNNSYQTIYSNQSLKTANYHETFDNSELTGNSYKDETFIGINNIEWNIIEGRNESDYIINEKGVLLRGQGNTYSSSLTGSFPNGLNSLSIDFRKAFTGGSDRNYSINITNNGFTNTYIIPTFGKSGTDNTIYNFKLNNLNFYGMTTVKIYARNDAQATFDNFKWTEFIDEASPNKITVSFDLDYDDAPNIPNQVINEDTIPLKPETPTRDDYTFLGWYLNDSLYNFNTPLNNDTTLIAKWSDDSSSHLINFNPMGGSSIGSMLIEDGNTISQPNEPTKHGFSFIDWYLDENYETIYDFNTPITTSFTLYAKWKKLFEQEILMFDFGDKNQTNYGSSEFTFINGYDNNSYTLFKKQAQVNNSTTPYHIDKGQMMILSPINNSNSESYVEFDLSNIDNISKFEFEFAPWSDADYNRIASPSRTIQISLEYYQGDTWVKVEDVRGKTNVSDLLTKGSYVWATFNLFNSGLYRIKYSASPSTGDNQLRVTVDNIKISAFFDMPDGNLITFDYNYPNSPSNKLEVVEDNELVNSFTPERLGFEFLGWYLNGNLFDFNTPITSNITLKAMWEQSDIVVTFDYGYLDKEVTVKLVSIGGTITEIVPDSRIGYNFLGWYETDIGRDIHDSYNFSKTPTENLRLIAKWELINNYPDDLIINDNDLSGYYIDIKGLRGEELVNALSTLITDTHTSLSSYGNARYALEVADRHPHDDGMVLGIYDRSMLYGPWNHPIWEREHVWPNSKLGVSRATNEDKNQASDLHNLRAIVPTVNQRRGNRYFVNTTLNSPIGHQIGTDAYYPGNEDIGDVARIFLYMALRYEVLTLTNSEALLRLGDINLNNNTPETAYMGKLEVLYKWHLLDPVDDFERNRNDVIYSYQGNRNPFIDHPELFKEVFDYLTALDNNRTLSTHSIITTVTPTQIIVDIYFFKKERNIFI
ncbi:MAG: InlB B-repeat-containing protein [Acholeplasmataceae bacterium]